jgi:caffeoyl-CoA O-methyltransferase
MSKRTIGLSDELHAYVVAHSAAPDPLVAELMAETQEKVPDFAHFQIAPEQAPFMTLMTQIIGVRTAVEIGTFTGLSALAIARGLPDDGKLICCDISEEFTNIAQRYWARGGMADRIELRLGPAIETLRAMPDDPHIDLAFIDADKTGYPDYYEAALAKLTPTGLIVADNTLRDGGVLAPDSESDRVMAQLNDRWAADERVVATQLTVRDGVTLIRPR